MIKDLLKKFVDKEVQKNMYVRYHDLSIHHWKDKRPFELFITFHWKADNKSWIFWKDDFLIYIFILFYSDIRNYAVKNRNHKMIKNIHWLSKIFF